MWVQMVLHPRYGWLKPQEPITHEKDLPAVAFHEMPYSEYDSDSEARSIGIQRVQTVSCGVRESGKLVYYGLDLQAL